MTDIFGIGTSALQAFQRALNTTGHNIANVNTAGFSRQSVDFSARQPDNAGLGFLGTGVEVSSINRNYDRFVVEQVRTGQSSFTQQQTLFDLSAQIDNLLGDSATSLSVGLQSFFNSAQQVADDPTSAAARQVMLTEGETLAARFHQLHQSLEDVRGRANAQIRGTVAEINGLATNIAELNENIVNALGQSGGQSPNDLLDQRDLLIEQLAQRVSVTTIDQDDGSLNVFLGTGQNLVLGNQTTTLTATPLGADPERLDIGVTIPGSTVRITDQISGGELGGLFDFRNKVLDPSQNALGNVGIGLASVFNAQHRQGMDLGGVVDREFFVLPQAAVTADSANAGPGPVTVAFDDVGQLTTDEYQLDFDGSVWNLQRISDGQTVAFESGSGTVGDPYIVNGLSIVTDSSAVAGDRYFIQPSRYGAEQIQLALSEGHEIAAAAAHYTESASANAGDGQISPAQVLDLSDPSLLNTVNIVFDDPSNYRVNGGPSQPYTSGADIDINGFRVQIGGTPQAGDTFTVVSNTGGVGDNSNALQLAGLQKSLSLAGGTASFDDAYSAIIADVGTRTGQAEINASAQQKLLEQAQATRESISGVNLDEEAANLLRFQQAYQAAAQVIAAADDMFNTLINAVRG
ncbi:MAG: flagellar hook-associated protein FlgK [Gammaproteobacteria bacterium]|nr:flagellar hook-associated protein FlgK [Gammaproteobacteria bacterium]